MTPAQYRAVTASRQSLIQFCNEQNFKGWPSFYAVWRNKEGKTVPIDALKPEKAKEQGFVKVSIAEGIDAA